MKCGGWDSGYVDETGRPLKKRIIEHQKDSSPVSQHANDSGHPVNYDQVKVLDRESGWFDEVLKKPFISLQIFFKHYISVSSTRENFWKTDNK